MGSNVGHILNAWRAHFISDSVITQVITHSPHTLCELPNLSMVGDVGLFSACWCPGYKTIYSMSVLQFDMNMLNILSISNTNIIPLFFSLGTLKHTVSCSRLGQKKYLILFRYGYRLEGYCLSPSVKTFFCWCSNTLVPAITAHIFSLYQVFLFSPSLLVLKSHFMLISSLLVCLAPLSSFLWATEHVKPLHDNRWRHILINIQ